MKKRIFMGYILALASVLLFLNGCSANTTEKKIAPKAINGIMDLSSWDLNNESIVNLDGEWEFYYSQLLNSEDFQDNTLIDKGSYINVPSSWNKHEIDGEKLSGIGYATYRLIIKISDDTPSILGLKIPRMFTNYKIWSEGELIAFNGQEATNKADAIPQYKPQVVMLKPHGNTIQLIVQISNFSHRSGGMLEKIKLGNPESIINARENRLALELFLFGCLFIIGIYHIVLFLFRKKDAAPLFFGLYCLLIAIRTLFVGEIFITQLFPNFNWEIQHKIQTLTFYIGVPTFVMFIYSLFPSKFLKKVYTASQVTGVIFSLLVLFTPAKIFNQINPVYQLITATAAICVIYSLVSAWRRKQKGAFVVTLSVFIFILTIINDMLFLSVPFNDYNIPLLRSIIVTGNLSSFGLIILVLSQSLVLAMNSSKAFSQVEEMTEKLIIADEQKDNLVATLESKVKERTQELEYSNNELEKAFHGLSRMEHSRRRLLSNISHDIRTPLTLIQGYSEAILDDVVTSEEDKLKYLHLIQNKIISITHLTDGLFELSQLESRHKKFEFEPINLSSFISKLESKYRYDVENAGLSFKLNAPEKSDMLINIDINQFDRIFSNLIYNSHDIKTPLTSIINYVDLIKKEDTENETVQEYINVLDRQSARLKKLIEDLVEASKASTGNIEVNMAHAEVGVLLTQTVGEYEEKIKNNGLELILKKPESEVFVMADGKLLWRVFDNLMNNICKYSQPSTRAYLNLETEDNQAIITFRNISNFPLNLNSDELLDRFIRGDSSRSTEGSGLGLSIAKSLTELQNGTFDLLVDGDLFKVVIKFNIVSNLFVESSPSINEAADSN